MKDIPAQELEASFLRGPLSFPHPTNSEPSINNFEPISETGTTNASLGPASPLKQATKNANFFGKARYSANYVRITIIQRRKWQVCWLMVSAFTSQPLLREVCSSILLFKLDNRHSVTNAATLFNQNCVNKPIRKTHECGFHQLVTRLDVQSRQIIIRY